MSVWTLVRLASVLGVLGALVAFATLYTFNHFAPAPEELSDACTPFTGIVGSEDLQVDHASRLVFLSSHDRRAAEKIRGAIHVLSVDDPLSSGTWKDRTGGTPEDFAPLGLSIYRDEDVVRLFVVNGAAPGVELFDVAANGDLTHLETLKERRLNSPNDVVAVGPRSFYVTNDTAAGRDTLLGRLEFLTRARSGRILYFNGISWTVAAEGLRFANGLGLSPDGSTLYATESAGMSLVSFRRAPATGVLSSPRLRALPGAGENLNVAASGEVLIAASPKPLAMSLHRRASGFNAPAMVVRFDPESVPAIAGGPETPRAFEPVFQSAGETLSAATTADMIDGQLFVGAFAEDRFLICRSAS